MGTVPPHPAGEKRQHHCWHEAEEHLRERECRSHVGHDDVRCRSEANASRARTTADVTDNDHVTLDHFGPELIHPLRGMVILAVRASDQREVSTGAEDLRKTAQHQDTGLLPRLSEALLDAVEHRAIQRVVALRPVKSEPGHSVTILKTGCRRHARRSATSAAAASYRSRLIRPTWRRRQSSRSVPLTHELKAPMAGPDGTR